MKQLSMPMFLTLPLVHTDTFSMCQRSFISVKLEVTSNCGKDGHKCLIEKKRWYRQCMTGDLRGGGHVSRALRSGEVKVLMAIHVWAYAGHTETSPHL